MKFKRICSGVLVLAMMITLVILQAYAYEDPTNDEGYTIDEPYEYPVKPGTDEWKAMKTLTEKLAVSQIPEDILQKMTTAALLDTVLNYPLCCNIFAYNTTELGIEIVSEQFNGLKELLNRDDFLAVATEKMEMGVNLLSEAAENENDIDLDLVFTQMVLEGILGSSISPMVDYIKGEKETPNGSKVEVRYYTPDLSAAEKISLNARIEQAFPDAIRLDDATRMYNCHNYAWDEEEPYDGWMPDPSEYMTDGSYTKINGSTLKAGDKLYSSSANHSAIIYSIGDNVQNPITATSKWGSYGLYRHRLYDCPYGDTIYTQWR